MFLILEVKAQDCNTFDSAYQTIGIETNANNGDVEGHKYNNRIKHKGYRNKPLTSWQTKYNEAITSVKHVG